MSGAVRLPLHAFIAWTEKKLRLWEICYAAVIISAFAVICPLHLAFPFEHHFSRI
jgi:hypothetical protein